MLSSTSFHVLYGVDFADVVYSYVLSSVVLLTVFIKHVCLIKLMHNYVQVFQSM